MQCVRCNRQFRLLDFVLIKENGSDLHDVTIQGMPESRLWRDWGQSPRQ